MSQEKSARLPAGIQNTDSADAGLRLEASHTFEVKGQIDQVFALFDPVSERDWVDDWNPVPIVPEELSRAEGTVFKLERDGRTAVWTVLRYSAVQHVAEYLVTEYDYQHRWIYVSCSTETDQTTRVMTRYVTTALSPTGQQDLKRYGKEFLQAWQEPVQTALDQSVE
jgi:hypothetical protein